MLHSNLDDGEYIDVVIKPHLPLYPFWGKYFFPEYGLFRSIYEACVPGCWGGGEIDKVILDSVYND
jgi:hypothetical protein